MHIRIGYLFILSFSDGNATGIAMMAHRFSPKVASSAVGGHRRGYSMALAQDGLCQSCQEADENQWWWITSGMKYHPAVLKPLLVDDYLLIINQQGF